MVISHEGFRKQHPFYPPERHADSSGVPRQGLSASMAQRVTPVAARAKKPTSPIPTPVAQERRRPERDFIETIWVLCCSVKFAVVQNIALALAAMLGTIIPQMQPGIKDSAEALDSFLTDAHARYGDLTGVLSWAGFFDLYNSLWFRMLVVVVVFSIIICTMNRWQPTVRLISKPMLKVSDGFVSGLTERAQFTSVPLSAEQADEVLRSALKKSRYRVLSDKSADGAITHLYADRDRWSKMVTFVSHAGLVLLILTAAGMTQIGWRERSVYFMPNDPVNVGHGTDFSVANVGWNIDYYPDGTTVKEFQNTLAVYENNTQVLTKTIIVNDPLKYKGVNFFLVSYEPVLYAKATDSSGANVPLRLMGQSGPITATVPTGEVLVDFPYSSSDNLPLDYVQLAGKDHTLTLEITYYQNVTRTPGENPPAYVKAYVDQNFNSTIYDAFMPRTGPLTLPGYGQYSFDFRQSTATILEVAKDQGLELVGFFFGIMALGFTISLYTTFTRCWAKIAPNSGYEGTVNITIGGLAEKNKVAFERDFEKLALRIQDGLTKETSTQEAENGI
jgi:cytochrome c biogenesis protein